MINEIIHGDCLEVMNDIPDMSIDLILCDLPYGSTRCKWDTIIPFESLWVHYKRIIKDRGVILLCGQEPFSSYLRTSGIDLYKYDWYWEKDKGANFLFGNKQPLKNIEIISCFYKQQPIYNPQKVANPKGTSKRHLSPNPIKFSSNVKEIMGDSWKAPDMGIAQNCYSKTYEPDKLLPKQLIYFAREQRNKLHPTQKPVALFEYLIKTYTNEGDLVLDNCAGSFTTAVASDNTKRNWVCIEKEAKYCEIGRKRIKENRERLLNLDKCAKLDI